MVVLIRIRGHLLIVAIVALSLSLLGGSVSALEQGGDSDATAEEVLVRRNPLMTVTQTRDAVRLAFVEQAATHTFLTQGAVQQRGRSPRFNDHSDGWRGQYYSAIASDREGGVTAHVRALVPLLREVAQPFEDVVSPEVSAPPVGYVASADFAHLFWQKLPDVVEYEILRDGKPLARTNETSFIDEGVAPGRRYRYRVEAVTQTGNPQFRKRQEAAARGAELPADADHRSYTLNTVLETPPSVPSASEGETLSGLTAAELRDRGATSVPAQQPSPVPPAIAMPPIDMPPLVDAQPVPLLQNAPDNTTIRHRAFIMDAFVSAQGCAGLASDQYFGGDNRSFDAISPNFRTTADVFVDWVNNRQVSLVNRTIGMSILYRKNPDGQYQEISRMQAPADGITIRVGERQNAEVVRFGFHHSVGNPYCPRIVSIDSTIDDNSMLGRSGLYELSGNHTQYPSFEIYYKDSTRGDYDPIHLFRQGQPICLVACLNHRWSASGQGYR